MGTCFAPRSAISIRDASLSGHPKQILHRSLILKLCRPLPAPLSFSTYLLVELSDHSSLQHNSLWKEIIFFFEFVTNLWLHVWYKFPIVHCAFPRGEPTRCHIFQVVKSFFLTSVFHHDIGICIQTVSSEGGPIEAFLPVYTKSRDLPEIRDWIFSQSILIAASNQE